MRWLALALALAPACFNPKYNNPTCGPNGECPTDLTCVAGACVAPTTHDSGVDPDGEMDDANTIDGATTICQGSGAWQVCVSSTVSTKPDVNLGATLDTTSSTLCEAGAGFTSASQPDVCVIAAPDITVTNTVTVQGARPLVLFATGAISITGVLDVGSHRLLTTGPGAAPGTPCNAFPAAPGASVDGGGGGAGGSFMSVGGNGGTGAMSASAGGVAAPVLGMPAALRGGCNGQTGGAGTTVGGPGGAGGGAVYLVAATIALNGSINASGAGGIGGPAQSGGGGGGGSGGMIVLQAASLTSTGAGKLAANGGGGGGGGGGSTAGPGSDGSVAAPTVPAAGGQGAAGNGCSAQATGGNGFAAGVSATSGTNGPGDKCGGAGGGAGAGYIRANAAITGAVSSPALTIVP